MTEEELHETLSKNIKKYRKGKLTQEQLSERLGISQKHLSIVETGIQFASASLIQKIPCHDYVDDCEFEELVCQ